MWCARLERLGRNAESFLPSPERFDFPVALRRAIVKFLRVAQ
jgi:hypothetical protein